MLSSTTLISASGQDFKFLKIRIQHVDTPIRATAAPPERTISLSSASTPCFA
jgi:hypothetical protein